MGLVEAGVSRGLIQAVVYWSSRCRQRLGSAGGDAKRGAGLRPAGVLNIATAKVSKSRTEAIGCGFAQPSDTSSSTMMRCSLVRHQERAPDSAG